MAARHRTAIALALGLTALPLTALPLKVQATELARAHSDKPACRGDDGVTAARHYEKAQMYAHLSARQAGEQQGMICLGLAALEGSVPAQGTLGMIYARTGYNRLGMPGEPVTPDDAEAAVYWLSKAAGQGDAQGAFELGRLYEYGLAGTQDDAQAIRLYTRAQDGHYRDAGTALKRVAARPESEKRFMDQYLPAAERGDAAAIMAIADAYIKGNPLRQSYEKAADWLRRLAEAGNSDAQSRLGAMYFTGAGVPRDLNLAVDWLLKASRGTNHRNDIILIGLYTSPDVDDPHKKAIAQRAAEARGTPFTEAAPEPQFDPRPDMAAVQARADKGNAEAQYTMGIFYLGVFGDPVDAQKALPWLIKAAEQDQPSAAINIANLYYTGKGVPKDYAEALRWYEKAAMLGDNRGLYNAAVMYRDGLGTTPDPLKAYALGLRIALGHMTDKATRGLIDKLRPQIPIEDRARCFIRANEMYVAHYYF